MTLSEITFPAARRLFGPWMPRETRIEGCWTITSSTTAGAAYVVTGVTVDALGAAYVIELVAYILMAALSMVLREGYE